MKKKIIIEVGHPNDVHQFKYLYHELKDIGWEALFLAKQKDIVIELMTSYNLPFKLIGSTRSSTFGKFITLFFFSLKHLIKTIQFKPDFILSRNSPHSAHVGKILSIPHIGFADTENSGIADKLAVSFINYIFTSYSFTKKFKKPQFYYPGYIETWYLHPNRFKPDPEVLNILGVQPGETYSILRFVSWQAHHDKGISGLTDDFKIKLVEKLLGSGKVFISSEKKLPAQLEQYRFKLPPEKMHDALYYASLFYGESATMASECAMMGTPAIFLDPVGRGYTDEQEEKYGLVSNFTLSVSDINKSLSKVDEILLDENYRHKLTQNHKRLLNDIIDPVNYVKWFLVNYPDSIETLKKEPKYWQNFK
jgi:uncharacterized protein